MRLFICFVHILVFVICTSSLEAQVVITSETPNVIDILQNASLTKPQDSSISIQKILNGSKKLNFKKIEEKPNISFTAKHYWLKFEIKNSTDKGRDYYLETARPIIDNVECYIIDEQGKIITQFSGDKLPLDKKTVKHHKTLFKLKLEAKSAYKVFIHYKSDGEVLSLPLILYTPDRFINETHNELIIFGLFYGVLLLAAIIYLFFYFGMRDKSFLYYSLYVLFIGLLQFSLDGLFHQYIMPGSGWLYLRSLILIAIVSPFLMSKYVVVYLNIKEHFKVIPKLFQFLNICLAILFFAVLISDTIFEISYPIANLLGLLILLLIIVSIVGIWFKNKSIDKYFITGIFCLVLGFTIFILNNLGILPDSLVTEYSTKLGTGLEVIFLSLSMANRIWKLKSEKEEMQSIALRKSEEANELKTNFMSMMSHELRTPLNAIMGIADVMSDEVTDEKIKNNFKLIKYSSVGLLSSVNDILDFSKMQKGKLELQNSDFNPNLILKQIVANWETQAKNKEVYFTNSLSKNIPQLVHGDVGRFTQILNNLLSNAVKFTNQGTISFSIEADIQDDNNALFTIVVTDTGIGISKKKQESIFESFIQESITDKRQHGGFGLGLPIIKHLVDLHKGTIEIDSEKGVGTTFTVTLPYSIVKNNKSKQLVFPKDEFDLKGRKILVVEDNDVNQFIMETILGKWKNTTMEVAENGKIALEKLQNSDFDIVLMDLQMPVMDGYEATAEIRKGSGGKANSEIPIIAVTADAMTESKIKAQNVGMDDYMTKPVDQALLYEKITKLLSPELV